MSRTDFFNLFREDDFPFRFLEPLIYSFCVSLPFLLDWIILPSWSAFVVRFMHKAFFFSQ